MQFTTNKRAIKKCILTSRIQIRSCSLSHKDILLNHREQFLVLKHGNQKNKHFGHSSHYLISLCHSTENKLKKWCELVSCTSHNPQQHKGQAKKKKKKQHSLLSLSLYLIFLLYPVCSVLMGSAQQPPLQYKRPTSVVDCGVVQGQRWLEMGTNSSIRNPTVMQKKSQTLTYAYILKKGIFNNKFQKLGSIQSNSNLIHT